MIIAVFWFIMSTIMVLTKRINLDTYYIVVMLYFIYLSIKETIER